jgi:hypothetical protein
MSNRLAFYTCFIGSTYSTVLNIPPLPSTKYDCYYFTNNEEMSLLTKDTGWKLVFLNIPIYNDYNKDCMNCKHIRCCPHEYDELKSYEYVCWFDDTLTVDCEKVEKLLLELERSNKSIVLSKHPNQYSDVWGEYYEAISYPRYFTESDRYFNYIQKKIIEKGNDILNVHYCGGFSIRKLTDKFVISYNNQWYSNILDCGIEDQISLQFIHQNYTDIILGIEYKECWDYIEIIDEDQSTI